jgi:hypothetical protein
MTARQPALTFCSGLDGYRLAFGDGERFEVVADRLTWEEGHRLYRSATALVWRFRASGADPDFSHS